MTSSNGSIFRITGHLCGEFTGHLWIPCTKASGTELCFLWSAPWVYGWVNNCEAGALRRHHAHYDIIVNTLRPSQNGRHFPYNIFKYIFMNENVWIPFEISLKFVHKGPINNIPALVQIMAWHCPGDKPLSEPIMVSLLTHICVTRPQWVKVFLNPIIMRLKTSKYKTKTVWWPSQVYHGNPYTSKTKCKLVPQIWLVNKCQPG